MVCKNITNYLLIHMFIQISASMCPYNYRGMLQEVCPQTLTDLENYKRSDCLKKWTFLYNNFIYNVFRIFTDYNDKGCKNL